MTDEYLTIDEVAAMLKITTKRVQNMMCSGIFQQGEHFFRPRGLRPRFKRSALVAWIEEKSERQSVSVPLKKGLVLKIPYGMRSHS